jgi:two-component system, NtrC family, response regulator HydG
MPMPAGKKSDPRTILIVDDNPDVQVSVRLLLKKHGYEVVVCAHPEEAVQHLHAKAFCVVLLDMNFRRGEISGNEGLAWLRKIRSIQPQAPVIMITAYGDIDLAIKAIKMGASDFVLKPWKNEKFLAIIAAAWSSVRDTSVASTEWSDEDFLGQSPAMERVKSLIEKVAVTDANVLLLGENGTGKDLVARAIHQRSHRSSQPLCKVDVGSISESLFESELFGHVKGTFTDAKADRTGWFETANKGTLFLDEIGNISLFMQSKLLNAIQSREITKVGSTRPMPINIRLICATNMPLYSMVEEGVFRKDLLYRINTVEITLPPLRERREDIPLLAEYFLGVFAARYGREGMCLGAGALRFLEDYTWPGNVRELQHALERAVILSDRLELEEGDFSLRGSTVGVSAIRENYTGATLEEMERTAIRDTLLRFQGNISLTARELGLTRAALYRRIEKYGI